MDDLAPTLPSRKSWIPLLVSLLLVARDLWPQRWQALTSRLGRSA